jgi:hypothetical protein
VWQVPAAQPEEECWLHPSWRLKLREREPFPVAALSDAELAAIAAAEVPEQYDQVEYELQAFFAGAVPAEVLWSEELHRDCKAEALREKGR